ncbi:major capsid protein [Peromfec virus RodF8_14]|uniref:Major capsid protein n=1 Tax=Peromfec virus RodF8_14 TaxID=2929359 RepID=A0A976N2L6_9VIRU|nr:major capsid protein [Peromfec virus RodF8_14]
MPVINCSYFCWKGLQPTDDILMSYEDLLSYFASPEEYSVKIDETTSSLYKTTKTLFNRNIQPIYLGRAAQLRALNDYSTYASPSDGSAVGFIWKYNSQSGESDPLVELNVTHTFTNLSVDEEFFVIPVYGSLDESNKLSVEAFGSAVPCTCISYTNPDGKQVKRLSYDMPPKFQWFKGDSSGDDYTYYEVNFVILVGRFRPSMLPVMGFSPSSITDGVGYHNYAAPFSDYTGTFYRRNRINALPFRAYESIYNSFYRDARNNPLIINGEAEYNKYIVSDEGGLDSTERIIYKRNWENDPFTTAVTSPQQGTAPLVGISSTGDVSFQSSEDGKTYTFSSETAEDADTITKINVTSNVPNDVSRSILDVVTQGISINDFRNVNALQRWLETNIRRGLKIKDQTKARWGVDIKESLLDMPEFIGGYSVDIDINQVSQTSETEVSPLGSYAGQATGFGGSKHDISTYCDQHGYIIGIVSVVPEPLYDQLLPKHYFKSSPLDYFSPEFGQIGMQPIYNKEIAPLSMEGSGDAVFGYQRPWYDYLYHCNELHGLFRTNLRNFVLARNFNNGVRLNESFTTIDHTSLNNIFSVDNSDKILGQIRFQVTASRPIPSTSVPSLG